MKIKIKILDVEVEYEDDKIELKRVRNIIKKLKKAQKNEKWDKTK